MFAIRGWLEYTAFIKSASLIKLASRLPPQGAAEEDFGILAVGSADRQYPKPLLCESRVECTPTGQDNSFQVLLLGVVSFYF
jgi:hypothetical protein